jgi:hypothetical protein
MLERFELSDCLAGRAAKGFSPKTSLDRICSQAQAFPMELRIML